MDKVALFSLVSVFVLAGCVDTGGGFDFEETDMSYYEFVREEPDLVNEYIIHSNGLVLMKKETGGRVRDAKIEVGVLDRDRADELIRKTEEAVGDMKMEGVDCSECRLYHIFYGDPGKTRSVTEYIDEAPGYIKEIENETLHALKELKPTDNFFLHFIYKKPGEEIVDYHFYSDGTTLLEEFGPRNGELKTHGIYLIKKEEIARIKQKISNEHFTSEDNLMECNSKGLEWGYLEIQKDDKYALVYTCGAGNSAADELFNELLEKTT